MAKLVQTNVDIFKCRGGVHVEIPHAFGRMIRSLHNAINLEEGSIPNTILIQYLQDITPIGEKNIGMMDSKEIIEHYIGTPGD